MKRNILLLLSFFILMLSCEKEEKPTIIINQNEFTVPDTGGSQSISFETNMNWTAESSESWCTIFPANGDASTKSATVTFAANETFSDRSCTVTIAVEGLSKTITINQSSNLGVFITQDKYNLTNDASIIEVELKTNVDFEVVIPEDAKTWVSYSPTRALRVETLTLNITMNDSYNVRTTEVYVKEKSTVLQDTLTIIQSGKPTHIPHFYIDTDDGEPIIIKDLYIKGNVRIDGGGKYEDYEGRTSIRGRGNSTWTMPKKPYRLKLDTKASLLGLAAEKDWILLQNYIDFSLMKNSVAMKIGQLLEMPFTHHMIPVDVTMNGEYIGSYTFTEHKEVEDNRINVGEDGWLIELDTNFDQHPWQFYSNKYELPVMIQYPELDKMSEAEATPIFNEMMNDFNSLEGLIFDESFPNNNYLDYFDAKAFVNYIIVYMLTDNGEINHPKSTYIYKKKGEKYSMGPIWDFDWAFGFSLGATQFGNPTSSLFWPQYDAGKGTLFFSRITQDPALQSLYRKEWAKFKSQNYPILVEYIKEYAETIRDSHAADQLLWYNSSVSIDAYLIKMLDYLDKRAEYMDGL